MEIGRRLFTVDVAQSGAKKRPLFRSFKDKDSQIQPTKCLDRAVFFRGKVPCRLNNKRHERFLLQSPTDTNIISTPSFRFTLSGFGIDTFPLDDGLNNNDT